MKDDTLTGRRGRSQLHYRRDSYDGKENKVVDGVVLDLRSRSDLGGESHFGMGPGNLTIRRITRGPFYAVDPVRDSMKWPVRSRRQPFRKPAEVLSAFTRVKETQ